MIKMLRKFLASRHAPLMAGSLLLAMVPLMSRSPYLLHMLILFFTGVVQGEAWNLLGGFTGQPSFGHAAFYGIGAYCGGLLFHHFGISPWYGVALGGIVSALIAIPVGWVFLRLRGIYFALAMLALAEVLRLVFLNWRSFTNGAVGILYRFTPKSRVLPYYMTLAMAMLTIFIIDKIMNSKLGLYFLAIREDQDAAESLGINTLRYKIMSFVISAFLVGVVGGFYTPYTGFIAPDIVFSLPGVTLPMILMAVLGGPGTIWGPVIGSGVMVAISEVLRSYIGEAHLLFLGVVLIIFIAFMPDGIWGAVTRLMARRKGHEAAS